MVFQIGNQISIKGLQSNSGKRYNGWTGEVTRGPDEKGRFHVKFLNGAERSFKTENLKLTTKVILCHNSKSFEEHKGSALVAQFVNSSTSYQVKKDFDRLSFKNKKLVFVTVDVEEMMDLAGQESVSEAENLPAYVFYLGGNRKDEMKIDGVEGTPDLAGLTENCATLSEEATNFLVSGTRVYIHGLQSAAGQKLNDNVGVVERGPLPNGRYIIQIDGFPKSNALKQDNLKVMNEASDDEVEVEAKVVEKEEETLEGEN